jgi:hypothetical protein
VKLTAKLIAAGMLLLVAALLSSLAAMAVVEQRVVRNSTVIRAEGAPASETIASILSGVSGGISGINVTVRNIGIGETTVIYMAHVGSKLSSQSVKLKPGESITFKSKSLLDVVVVRPSYNVSKVYLEVEANIVERRLLGLGVLGLILFIVGSVLVSVGVMLRLSGLETE